MIFDDGVLVLYYVFMVETFEDIDLFFDSADVLFTYRYLFHGYQDAVIEVDAFVDFTKCTFTDLLDQLVALDYLAFCQTTHVSKNYKKLIKRHSLWTQLIKQAFCHKLE